MDTSDSALHGNPSVTDCKILTGPLAVKSEPVESTGAPQGAVDNTSTPKRVEPVGSTKPPQRAEILDIRRCVLCNQLGDAPCDVREEGREKEKGGKGRGREARK